MSRFCDLPPEVLVEGKIAASAVLRLIEDLRDERPQAEFDAWEAAHDSVGAYYGEIVAEQIHREGLSTRGDVGNIITSTTRPGR